MAVNQIKYGAIISYLALFVNVLIGLIYTPWLILLIGKSDYGLYTLAMSIIGLLAFDFGLGNAITKFITQYLAEGRQDKIDHLLGLIYKLYLVADLFILGGVVTIYFFLPDIYTGLTNEEMERFSKVFLIAATYCVLSFPFIPLNGVLTSYEKFIQLKICDLIYRLVIVVTMTICLLLGYGLYMLVLVNSGAGILNILMKLSMIRRVTPVSVKFHYWSFVELKAIFAFIVWVTIAALAQRLIFNVAPSILGVFSDSQAIAILGVAITFESYSYMFANALNGMFLPRVSRLMVDNNTEDILQLMIKIGRIQIYIIGFICIWLIAFGRHFITVWVGDSYGLVYICAILIVIPSFFQLPQEIGITYMVAANKVRQQSYVYVVMGVVNVLLSIPLTLKFGVVGMCMSIFLAYMIRTVGLNILFKQVLELDIVRFFRDSFILLSVPLLASLLACWFVNDQFPSEGWLWLTLKSGIGLLIFTVIMYCFAMNRYEKNLFTQPFVRLKRIMGTK